MIEVNQFYKDNVYTPSRKTTARVKFEILDNSAYEDCHINTSTEAIISRKDQLINKERETSFKYATYEKNYFKLDGSFRIPPKNNEIDNNELGWWSDDICNDEGIFDTPQVIDFTFDTVHHSPGLTINFDTKNNEYATDFKVEVFDENNNTIYTKQENNNTKDIYLMATPLEGYKHIKITINKWGKSFRRAKVVEVDFGISQEYHDEKIRTIDIIEEISIANENIPSSESTVVLDNQDRTFNVLNRDGFNRFLQERQQIKIDMGVETSLDIYEYVPMGVFYLRDWQIDEGAISTTLTSRDIIDVIATEDYEGNISTNLYDLAEDIFTKTNVEKYNIDTNLKTIPTNGFDKKIKVRQALQHIAVASKAAIYQDRYGVLQVKRFELLDAHTTYMMYAGIDMYCGMVTPTVDKGIDMKELTLDQMYAEPQIKLDKLLKSVTIKVNEIEYSFTNPGVREGENIIIDNPLILTEQHAAEIAEWIINESNLRAIYNIRWRQNPALERGDIIKVEDSFGSNKQSRILRNEFSYAGYLSGNIVAKGGV